MEYWVPQDPKEVDPIFQEGECLAITINKLDTAPNSKLAPLIPNQTSAPLELLLLDFLPDT